MLVRRVGAGSGAYASPYADIENVRREMFRLFDALAGNPSTEAPAGVFPPINVTQDADSFYVRAELPGIDPEDLSITAVKNRVVISGKREIKAENGRGAYHRREREAGTFNRTVDLRQPIDAERVEARYTDGILTVALPKAEDAKPRQITVKS